MYKYFDRALQIYGFEHADGAGHATDLVIQPFVRLMSNVFFSVIISAGLQYLLVSNNMHPLKLIFLIHACDNEGAAMKTISCTSLVCCYEQDKA